MGFVADESAGDLMTQRIIDDIAQSQRWSLTLAVTGDAGP